MTGAKHTHTTSWDALRSPSGLRELLRQASPVVSSSPSPSPSRLRSRRLVDTFVRRGLIIAHALPAALSEQEFLLIMAGGTRRRLAQARRTNDGSGRPIFDVSARVDRQRLGDLDRIALDRYEVHNVGCNAGRGNLLNFAILGSGFTGVQWFAVGQGSPVVNATDPQLSNEGFRKQPSSYSVSGNQALITTFFQTTDANFTYSEAGIFGSAPAGTSGAASGGPTASSTGNTGMLWAHAPYAYTKNSTIQLSNNYYISES